MPVIGYIIAMRFKDDNKAGRLKGPDLDNKQVLKPACPSYGARDGQNGRVS